MTTATNPRQRISASAAAEGLTPCEWCHTARCERCGSVQRCHTNSEYMGGHGYSLVTSCHEDRECWERRERL